MKKKEGKILAIATGLVATLVIIPLLILVLQIIPFTLDFNLSDLSDLGQFISGTVGTAIIAFGLWVAYRTLKESNSQTYQNTLALLFQSYHHTVEDFDYNENCKKETGREAIRILLNEFSEIVSKSGVDVKLSDEAVMNFLTKKFPTHIPAIIVSILHSVHENCPNRKTKRNLFKQIKSMLSYEERILLLLFVAEQIANHDNDNQTDWCLIRKHIFTRGIQSSPVNAYPEYVKLLITINNCR